MPRGKPNPPVLQHPAATEAWRDRFRCASMRVGFTISLSRAMLEMLCAVSEDVQWDRSLFRNGTSYDNWIASTKSLEKRGLIERKSDEELKPTFEGLRADRVPRGEWTMWKLTTAGYLIVELVEQAGMFVEADAAINKKARQA